MSTAYTPLTIVQGAEWSHSWAVTVAGQPLDGTWVARAQVRPRGGSPTLLAELTASVDMAASVVTVSAAGSVSRTWDWTTGEYDVLLTRGDGTVSFRVAEGPVTVDEQVTVP